jgi:two-component system, chemotaxis family, sensor kinase CheA
VTTNDTIELKEAVLLVDDEDGALKILCELVEDLGYRCKTASNGKEGLKKIEERDIFMVITDNKMPEMSGLEMAEHIRKEQRLLPIGLISGFGDKELMVKALKIGITDFFDKPLQLDLVEAFIVKSAQTRLQEIKVEMSEMESLKSTFLEEARAIIFDLESQTMKLREVEPDEKELNSIFRKMHTLKGSASVIVGTNHLVSLAHAFETVLSKLKTGTVVLTKELQEAMLAAVDTISACIVCLADGVELPDTTSQKARLAAPQVGKAAIDTSGMSRAGPANEKSEKIDAQGEGIMLPNSTLAKIQAIATQIVQFNAQFSAISRRNRTRIKNQIPSLVGMDVALANMADALDTEMSSIQNVTLATVFSRFHRVVRQVAGEIRKQIKLEIIGQDITVDRILAKDLAEALIHAVRNSCDHGIEMPDARVSAGKEPQGTIIIRGSVKDSVLTVEVEDDGEGLNRERIIAKALEKHLITQEKAKLLPDRDVWEMLFLPDFSTAAKLSNLSGRGVGMDVVKTVALKFGGSAWLHTIQGKSTKLTINVASKKHLVLDNFKRKIA